MGRRRGFFAELQHQAEVAARERAKAARQAEREQNAEIRRAEQARRGEERAVVQRARADAAEQKRLEKEAREAHIAAMEADVERRNSELSEMYAAIDSLLAATLDIDDHVDLTTLHIVAEHPPFDRADLEVPLPAPHSILDPPTPVFSTPDPPKGLSGLFGKKNHEKAVAEAADAHEKRVAEWHPSWPRTASSPSTSNQHANNEAERVAALEAERGRVRRRVIPRSGSRRAQSGPRDAQGESRLWRRRCGRRVRDLSPLQPVAAGPVPARRSR